MQNLVLFFCILLLSLNTQAQDKSEPTKPSVQETPSEKKVEEKKNVSDVKQPKDSTEKAKDQSIKPEENPFEKQNKFGVSAGVGYRQTTWNHIEDADNTNANYTVKSANYTIVEGDIQHKELYLKVGFNAQKETGGLEKASQFMGYLGIKGISIRSERGKFVGRVYFGGTISAEQTRDIEFEQTYSFTEIDYSTIFNGTPMTFGIRKTKWKIPTEIALLGPGESSGPTIFDEDFEAEITSFIFGMDYFKHDFLHPENITPGLGALFNFFGGFGFGTSKIGKVAEDAVKSEFNKTITENEPGIFAIHTSGQLGVKYVFEKKGVTGIVGAGYDWNLLMLLGTPKEAITSNEVQPVAYPNFVYQGPILRLHALF